MAQRRFLIAAGVLACLATVWAIWSVPLVLTNDGPEALLTAHMEAHYDDPDSVYARQFAVGFGLSGRGFSLVYRPFAELVQFPNSLRLAQLVIVLSLAFTTLWLSSAIAGGLRWSSLLGFAIAFSWPFYMGFYSFALSTAVGLAVLAFVVSRTGGLSALDKAAVSTALLVQLFMHGFAVFVTLALLGLVVGARAVALRRADHSAWRQRALPDFAWLAASSLPSVAVFLIMRSGQKDMTAVAASGTLSWASLADSAHAFPRLAIPGSTPLGLAVLSLAFASIARTALRLRRGPRRPEEVALFFGAVAQWLAAVALPLNLPGWQFFSPRFVVTGLALSLSLLGCEQLAWKGARPFAGLAFSGLLLACVWSARSLHQRLATACSDGIRGLEHQVSRKSFQLPIVLDANCGLTEDGARGEVPYSTPLLHFPALFAVTHGGTVPYGFSGPATVQAFVPRSTPLVPIPSPEQYWGLSKNDHRLQAPEARSVLLTELAVFGSYYENILVFGATTGDRDLLLNRGYVIDFEHGSFINAHHVPCPVELVIPVLPTDPPVTVRGGLGDHELWGSRLSSSANKPAILASLSTLCGEVWLRPMWSDGAPRCTNADARGRLTLRAGHTGTRVMCERPQTQ